MDLASRLASLSRKRVSPQRTYSIYTSSDVCPNMYRIPYLHMNMHLYIYLSIFLSFFLSISLSIHLSIHPSIIYPSIHLSSIHLSIYRSICLAIYYCRSFRQMLLKPSVSMLGTGEVSIPVPHSWLSCSNSHLKSAECEDDAQYDTPNIHWYRYTCAYLLT